MKKKEIAFGLVCIVLVGTLAVYYCNWWLDNRRRLDEWNAKTDAYFAELHHRIADFEDNQTTYIFEPVAPLFIKSQIVTSAGCPSADNKVQYFFVEWYYNHTTEADLRDDSVVKAFVSETIQHNITLVMYKADYPYYISGYDQDGIYRVAAIWYPAFSYIYGNWIYALLFRPHYGLPEPYSW